jgi:hypothetical protein
LLKVNLVKYLSGRVAALLLCCAVSTANAGPYYQVGRITNVTFTGDNMLIILDSGLPDNCAGTPYGWMWLPASAKPMMAFVMGLWLRGDLSKITVTVYTSGRDATSFCQVNQIDPAE